MPLTAGQGGEEPRRQQVMDIGALAILCGREVLVERDPVLVGGRHGEKRLETSTSVACAWQAMMPLGSRMSPTVEQRRPTSSTHRAVRVTTVLSAIGWR